MQHARLPKPPTAEEERELARAAKAGDREARRKLVEGHLRLVFFVARSVAGGGVEADEIAAELVLFLDRTIDAWSPDGGARLMTYVGFGLKQRAWRARRRLRGAPALSLNVPAFRSDGDNVDELLDQVVDEHAVHASDALEHHAATTAMRAAIDELASPQREAVEARFIRGELLEESAARAGVSRETMRQRERAGLYRLHMRLGRAAPALI